MLAGLTSRWKQAVAYHFTGSSFDAQKVKDCLFEVIQCAESAGVTVDAVVTDMGPGNMAIWRLCNIQATKCGKPKVSCPHPCGHKRQLYFIADAPHLLKNLRGHLVRRQDIILDPATVAKHALPCNKVSLEHVWKACEIDAGHKLKLLPHLRLRDLDPNHFEKMNVASAHALLHHATAAALRYLVQKGQLPKEALTTAFFLEEMFWWFTIMTSRTRKTALSDLNSQKADEAKTFLKGFIAMFSGLSITDKRGKSCWKPVQTGAVLSTLCALELRQHYIVEQNFKFLMLSRLSQDALENLFSTIRLKTPVPRAREFKSTFRVIVLAQFSQPSRNGSYAIDDSQDLLTFLTEKKELVKGSTIDDVIETSFEGVFELCQEEEDSLEYFAGYVAYALTHKYTLCSLCRSSIIDDTRRVPELVALKCYVRQGRNPLKVPSDNLLQLLHFCEQLFRINETRLLESKCTLESLKKATQEKCDVLGKFPSCHSVAEKAIGHFFLCRLRFALKQRNAHLMAKQRQAGKCASKSIGMRVLSEAVI
uniref:p-32 hm n=1 Tax=Rhipicephalus zambeziensis TaxID=60191 RepID=A0A224YVC6_9ACAR